LRLASSEPGLFDQSAHDLQPTSRPFIGPVVDPSSWPQSVIDSSLGTFTDLVLHECRGYGGIWDAFSARVDRTTQPLFMSFPPLLIKITNLSCFPLSIDENDWDRSMPSQTDARQHIARESRIVHGPLKALQGLCVARYFGLWAANQPSKVGPDRETWCAVYEDVGLPLSEGEKGIPAVR
jgi:hypothetical protein